MKTRILIYTGVAVLSLLTWYVAATVTVLGNYSEVSTVVGGRISACDWDNPDCLVKNRYFTSGFNIYALIPPPQWYKFPIIYIISQ